MSSEFIDNEHNNISKNIDDPVYNNENDNYLKDSNDNNYNITNIKKINNNLGNQDLSTKHHQKNMNSLTNVLLNNKNQNQNNIFLSKKNL